MTDRSEFDSGGLRKSSHEREISRSKGQRSSKPPPRDPSRGPTERGGRASKVEEHYKPRGGHSEDKPTGEINRFEYEIVNEEKVHRELRKTHEECGRGVHQFDSLANGVRVTS